MGGKPNPLSVCLWGPWNTALNELGRREKCRVPNLGTSRPCRTTLGILGEEHGQVGLSLVQALLLEPTAPPPKLNPWEH